MPEPQEVYYLGPITSFHHQVALKLDQIIIDKKLHLIPVDSFEQIFDQVEIGKVGVIACENLISGPIQSNIDYIIQAQFKIIKKIRIPIDFYLAGYNNSNTNQIDTVIGHSQAFIQTSEYLKSVLPNAIRIQTSSNSRAAEIISQDELPRQAALCNQASIEHFGLKVLASKIQNNKDNWTEFWVISSPKFEI